MKKDNKVEAHLKTSTLKQPKVIEIPNYILNVESNTSKKDH